MRSALECPLPLHGTVCATVVEEDGRITEMHLYDKTAPNAPACTERRETPLLRKAVEQLHEYCAGLRKSFDLPLNPKGTEFQQRAWAELCRIPYGQTRSYGQIAAALGNARACRAVGMANNRNPIAVFIPCHRVIGTDGRLVGYAGGLHLKELLLKLEGSLR